MVNIVEPSPPSERNTSSCGVALRERRGRGRCRHHQQPGQVDRAFAESGDQFPLAGAPMSLKKANALTTTAAPVAPTSKLLANSGRTGTIKPKPTAMTKAEAIRHPDLRFSKVRPGSRCGQPGARLEVRLSSPDEYAASRVARRIAWGPMDPRPRDWPARSLSLGSVGAGIPRLRQRHRHQQDGGTELRTRRVRRRSPPHRR